MLSRTMWSESSIAIESFFMMSTTQRELGEVLIQGFKF